MFFFVLGFGADSILWTDSIFEIKILICNKKKLNLFVNILTKTNIWTL